tara:strand:+ start:922 stop:1287 length:366 start_codon:yes stop_codon:yes gene_type:complete
MAYNRRRNHPGHSLPPQNPPAGRRRNLQNRTAVGGTAWGQGEPPALTPEQSLALQEFAQEPYEVQIQVCQQVAGNQGYDRGWCQRNLSKLLGVINKLPARQSVSQNAIRLYSSHLPPPDQL